MKEVVETLSKNPTQEETKWAILTLWEKYKFNIFVISQESVGHETVDGKIKKVKKELQSEAYSEPYSLLKKEVEKRLRDVYDGDLLQNNIVNEMELISMVLNILESFMDKNYYPVFFSRVGTKIYTDISSERPKKEKEVVDLVLNHESVKPLLVISGFLISLGKYVEILRNLKKGDELPPPVLWVELPNKFLSEKEFKQLVALNTDKKVKVISFTGKGDDIEIETFLKFLQ